MTAARPRLGKNQGPTPILAALEPKPSLPPEPPPPPPPSKANGTRMRPRFRETDQKFTRHTTVAVDIDVDDAMDAYFRRVKRYRTKSELWNEAMRFFLHHKNSEAT